MLDYCAVRLAVTKMFNQRNCLNVNGIDNALSDLNKCSNKEIRHSIQQNHNFVPKCVKLWENRSNINISLYYNVIVLATKETRLRTLHFKIVHGIYPTNILLQKMGIKEHNTCDMCHDLDTLTHFFYECPALKDYWDFIQVKLNSDLGCSIQLNSKIALFGITQEDTQVGKNIINEINLILIIAKLSISKHKYSKYATCLTLLFQGECILRRKSLKMFNE